MEQVELVRASSFRERATATGFVGRLDILEGPTGRRHWPDGVKARIVRESFEAGERVGAVARRHGLLPQQLTRWRRAAREGRLTIPLDDDAGFVPVVVDDGGAHDDRREGAAPAVPAGTIEIAMDGLVLRVPIETAPSRIAAVVSALRSAS
jgi:transposase